VSVHKLYYVGQIANLPSLEPVSSIRFRQINNVSCNFGQTLLSQIRIKDYEKLA